MKIFIYSRPRDYTTKDVLARFVQIGRESGLDCAVNEDYADHARKTAGIDLLSYTRPTPKDVKEGAMMVAIGGDGTFLEAVRNLRGLPMPIVGVNTGRLGFLASISPGDFSMALDEIAKGNYRIEKRTMLSVEGDFGATPEFPCALNEFTIHRHAADMLEVRTFVDGQPLGIARGDGAIVSTPTGSTAYSLSVGGPLVAPECGCFVLSVIAPHSFSARPLVVPDTCLIETEVRSRGKEVLVSLDNSSYIVGNGARFTIKKAKYYTFLAHIQNISFYDTLRDKIMWSVDKRDFTVEKF